MVNVLHFKIALKYEKIILLQNMGLPFVHSVMNELLEQTI